MSAILLFLLVCLLSTADAVFHSDRSQHTRKTWLPSLPATKADQNVCMHIFPACQRRKGFQVVTTSGREHMMFTSTEEWWAITWTICLILKGMQKTTHKDWTKRWKTEPRTKRQKQSWMLSIDGSHHGSIIISCSSLVLKRIVYLLTLLMLKHYPAVALPTGGWCVFLAPLRPQPRPPIHFKEEMEIITYTRQRIFFQYIFGRWRMFCFDISLYTTFNALKRHLAVMRHKINLDYYEE